MTDFCELRHVTTRDFCLTEFGPLGRRYVQCFLVGVSGRFYRAITVSMN